MTEQSTRAMLATLDTFTRAYVECALWISTDDSGRPMDSEYSMADIAAATLRVMIADCDAFQAAMAEYITDDCNCLVHTSQWTASELAGHDFWLTRNRHGAGFWDGDWTDAADAAMTAYSHAAGEQSLYVGDDGEIYI